MSKTVGKELIPEEKLSLGEQWNQPKQELEEEGATDICVDLVEEDLSIEEHLKANRERWQQQKQKLKEEGATDIRVDLVEGALSLSMDDAKMVRIITAAKAFGPIDIIGDDSGVAGD